MDFVSLSKILPLFIYPFNLGVLLLLTGVICYRFSHKMTLIFSLLSLSVFLLGSSPVLSKRLFLSLENQYPANNMDDMPRVDKIILLGGGVSLPIPPRTDFDLNSGADRIRYAARLYQMGKATKIIISGGQVFHQPGINSEAYYISLLLKEWGVPESAIILEDKSRNTYQNAKHSQLFTEDNEPVLLVTSAYHMPRSMALFESQGVNVIAAPTDYKIVKENRPLLLELIPNVSAMGRTTTAIKEYLGLWVYQLKEKLNYNLG